MDFKKKNFVINREQGEALEGSIKKWQRRACGESIPEGYSNCDLCVINGVGMFTGSEGCEQCVVCMHTGERQCKGTPYIGRHSNPTYCIDIVEFLKGLRVYKDEGIEVGDNVTIQDFSYCDTPTSFGRQHYNTCDEYNVYNVLATGVNLPIPKGETRISSGRNDTILHHVEKDYYVFCGMNRLRLAPLKCSKCGK